MNKGQILNSLNRAKQEAGRIGEGNIFNPLGVAKAIDEAIAAIHAQQDLVVPQDNEEALLMLANALQPFAAILTPDVYKDSDPVAVEIKVPREIAEKYAKGYDEYLSHGVEPPYARPDLETGKNWPTQVLNLDGVNIGDIRFAKRAMDSITSPEEKVLN